MGNQNSHEVQEVRRDIISQSPTARHGNAATLGLYGKLYRELIKCPIGGQQFLPLHILHEVITTETVQVNHPAQSEQIVRDARKIFGILVLIGHEGAIEDLLSDELSDRYLPLERGHGDNHSILESRQIQGKVFKAFQDWDKPQITAFLEKQWQVQAPVFRVIGSHFEISAECALPLQDPMERIGDSKGSTVYGCALHPSHCQWRSQVSNTSA